MWLLIIRGLNKRKFACGNLWCLICKGFEWFLDTNTIRRAYTNLIKFIVVWVTTYEDKAEWSIVVRPVTYWHYQKSCRHIV